MDNFETAHCADEEVLHELPSELWIKIFALLSSRDLQEARLVCKRWENLAGLPEFMNRRKLKVTKSNLSDIKMHLQTKHQAANIMKCNSLELDDLKTNDDLKQVLIDIGQHVKSLTLEKSAVFENLQGNLPNLEALSISHLMTEISNPEAMDLNSFAKLRSLRLKCSGVSRQLKARLLQQLTRESTCSLQLEELAVHHTREQEELLLHVLETHAATLRHLNLNFFTPPALGIGLRPWCRLFQQFEHLETLKLSGNCRYEWLEVVFSSLPSAAPLRKLDLSGIVQLNDALLTFIVQKWAQTLEHLELMFCVLISDESILQLRQVSSRLRVLNLAFCRSVTARGLLEGIASKRNHVLRELYLNDLHQLNEACICALAASLPQLEVLSVENCSNAVTDRALAHIFRHQTHLQHLVLDDCIRITDEGLLGLALGEVNAYPIGRLRGLQRLSLRGCRNLSNRTLAHALNFNELRSLTLGYCHKISAKGFEKLVLHCPALESLVISSCLMLDDEALLHIAKGLRRLRKLNVSNCLNLTVRSVDYIAAYCDSLQELTMCGVDSLEICEVQQRLLDVKPQLKELNL